MPKTTTFADVQLDVAPGSARVQAAPDSDTPFRILVLGDFSGRESRGVREPEGIRQRKPILVDRDNFESVMERLAVRLELPYGDDSGRRLGIDFTELDDFLPDRLYERLDLFAELRQARSEPPPRRAAAASPARSVEPTAAPARPSGDLLGSILEETAERSARSSDPLASYIDRIMEPHLEPKGDPDLPAWIAQVDEAASQQMRAVMHHPSFQALEAAWRGLFFLVRHAETGPDLKIYILDVSKEELEADLRGTDHLPGTGLYEVLVRQTVGTPGAHPWAVCVGDFLVAPERAGDIDLLARVALLAAEAGTPFLAGTRARWSEGAEANWEVLRELPESAYVGIATPRFLLRLPYGSRTDRVEQFDFEEMPEPRHQTYLWGNPAFFCATLLAAAFAEEGWSMRAGTACEIRGLPIHTYEQDGETKMMPPAEHWLTMEAVEGLVERGLMPLISIRDSDAVRVARFQSVRRPLAALAGRWG